MSNLNDSYTHTHAQRERETDIQTNLKKCPFIDIKFSICNVDLTTGKKAEKYFLNFYYYFKFAYFQNYQFCAAMHANTYDIFVKIPIYHKFPTGCDPMLCIT